MRSMDIVTQEQSSYSGLPVFSSLKAEKIVPAVREMLADAREKLKTIRQAEPGWETTVLPMELLNHQISRAWSPVSHVNSVVNTPELRQAYNQCLPLLSDFFTGLGQDQLLYRAYCKTEQDDDDLSAEQRQVLRLAIQDFRLSGVGLERDKQQLFAENASKLATLQSRFEENLLDAGNAWQRQISDPAIVGGLPASLLESAAASARDENADGWLLRLDQPTYHAVMSHAENRELRESFYEAWVTQASDQGPHAGRWDNFEIMEEIMGLRHANARMLDFDNFAEYSMTPKMAGSVTEVFSFLTDLAQKSAHRGKEELAELVDFAGKKLAAWDLAYYSEKLKQSRCGISEEELRPYFPVDRVLPGLFSLATRLFGIRLEPRNDIDTWHDDTVFYELRAADGELIGGLYVDLYARPAKRGGAWMDECIGRVRTRQVCEQPVAYLVCNFMRPLAGRPALLTHSDVVTLFHEFGHALHHLLTQASYPSVAGINGVPWDAVELPSQLMENFAWEPEVLSMVSGHFETGEPLPQDVVDRLLGSRQFQSSLQMLRQLEFAIFDLRLHADYDPARGARILETLRDVREEISIVPVPDWNRFANGFSHVFAGGYAAGYYSYKWAEVLAADAYAAFSEEGLFNHEVADRYRQNILAQGGARGAMENFVAFRGRPPRPDALLVQAGILDRAPAPS
ncbi:MAG: M3 family metallopeptidase [Gammaproteobacteria bacterium]|nr:M3 family metallopeptidase [Gammaproteobacteria bacterium]